MVLSVLRPRLLQKRRFIFIFLPLTVWFGGTIKSTSKIKRLLPDASNIVPLLFLILSNYILFHTSIFNWHVRKPSYRPGAQLPSLEAVSRCASYWLTPVMCWHTTAQPPDMLI